MRKRSRLRRSRFVCEIAFCIFFLLFVFSSVKIIQYYLQGAQEENAFAELAASVTQEPQPKSSNADGESLQTAPPYTEYLTLCKQNSDFAAWLHIDNTNINYPVMLTPDEPEYYLHRAFDKTSSQSGTPFIGAGGSLDSNLFIIYGHNMKNATMFGTLDWYTEKGFWEKTPAISLTTVTEHRTYEVFAAVETRVLYEEEAGFRWYDLSGELTEEAFDKLTAWLSENALYDTGIVPAYGEQIVLLSTCSYHTKNGRFLIAARRISS